MEKLFSMILNGLTKIGCIATENGWIQEVQTLYHCYFIALDQIS